MQNTKVQMRIKGRHRMRVKEIKDLMNKVKEYWGVVFDEMELDKARCGDLLIIFYRDKPLFFRGEGDVYLPTIYFLLYHPVKKKSVIVDMGGVKAISSGANIMAPGVVNCDQSIKEGDTVVVKEERYGRPLAVGISQMCCTEMIESKKGIAVKSIHHVGDKIWRFGDEH